MTTKLREKIIKVSRNEKIRNMILIYFAISIILAMISLVCIENMFWITSIIMISWILLMLIYDTFDEIENQEEEFIKNNKLLYIILSSDSLVSEYLFWLIWVPILIVTSKFIMGNFFTIVVLGIVIIVIILILAIIISKYFKKKLLE